MKKTFYFILLFFVLSGSCFGQKNVVENNIITCQTEIYNKAGFDLNKIVIDYENILIENEILQDKTGASYSSLLNKIVTDENYQIDSLISFYDVYPLFKISESGKTKILNCETTQINNDKNNLSKWKKISKKIDSIKFGEGNVSRVSKIFLETLSKNDFEMNFYKIKTFLVIEMVNLKYGSRKLLPSAVSIKN